MGRETCGDKAIADIAQTAKDVPALAMGPNHGSCRPETMFRKTWRHVDIVTGAHTSEKTELTRARRPTHRRLYSLYSWGSAIDVGLSPPAALAEHDGGQLQARAERRE